MESRDTRGQRNKKQGLLNYSIKFKKQTNPEEKGQEHEVNKGAEI